MTELSKRKCIPCEDKKITPLAGEDLQDYLDEVIHWSISDDRKKIAREFTFKNFIEAVDFVNRIADIAEEEGHHPDLKICYNKVTVELWTHSIGGLSTNDFIVASKIDLIAFR